MKTKNSILAAALFCTTALIPVEAVAAPVTAFVAAFTGAAGTTAAVGAALFPGITAVGTFLGQTIVGRLLLGIGLNLAANALRRRPGAPPPPERLVSIRQDISYMQHAYGRVRVAGPVGFWSFPPEGSTASPARYYNAIISSSQINGVLAHVLDDRVVTLGPVASTGGPSTRVENVNLDSLTIEDNAPADDVTYVQQEEFRSGGRSRGQIKIFDGRAGQPASTILSGVFPQWTASHNMRGLAYATVVAHRPAQNNFSTVYPTQREWSYAPIIEGKNDILDPRSGQRGYTRNAALVIADWIQSPYGLNRQVDTQNVIDEANASDVLVSDRTGVQRRKWTLNGVVYENETKEQVRSALAVGADVFFYERPDGQVGFNVGRWIEPDVTLRDNNFLTISLSEGDGGANAINQQTVSYIEPARGFREAESGIFTLGNQVPPNRDSVSALWIDNHNQAARVAKRLILSSRSQYKLSATLNLEGYNLIGKRFFNLDHSELDISGAFEVSSLTRNEDGITFNLEASSVRESDFDFDAATEEPEQPEYNTIQSADPIAEPIGLTITAGQSSGGSAAIVISWTAPADETLNTRIRYRAQNIPDPQEFLNIDVVDGQTSEAITGLVNNQVYEIQIRHMTPAGRSSDYVPDTPATITAIADTTPPDGLQAFSVALDGSTVIVSLTPPVSPNYAATRIYRQDNVTGTPDFNDATLIRTEFGFPDTPDEYRDEGLSSGNYAYWGIPINGSGVPSTAVSGPEQITV